MPVTAPIAAANLPTGLLIGGSWLPASDHAVFSVDDPSTGQTIAEVADATPADARAALDAAVAAQDAWAATSARQRSEILRRAFDLVTAASEDIATLITAEMGKPLAESRAEVAYGAEFLRWFAEEAPRIAGRYSAAPDGVNRLLVTKRPVGPCLLITPWNFPLAMATRKIAPALAAGCTMVLKPAELTPLTTLLLAALLREAGVPGGVVNIVTTTRPAETIQPLLADPRLRKLSFTGSTAIGRRLLAGAAESVLRVSMELGGNAPFLVFDDADLDAAVAGAVVAKLRNGAQACVAANRFLVHAAIAEEFTIRLADALAGQRLGGGLDPQTTLGPLISPAAVAKVEALVEGALADGARVVGTPPTVPDQGYFTAPRVLANVPPGAAVVTEEIFGPIAPVVTFDTEDEAVALANATPYGLVAFAYTTDLNRAVRLSERLETGMLGINTGLVSNAAAPFGGVKHSGMGREGGTEGIEEYLETVYVAIADPFAPGKA